MLDRVLSIKVWLFVATVLTTSAIASVGTYAVLQSRTVPPIECEVCPTCSTTPNTPTKSDRWNYKPLPYRGGKSY